MASKSEWVGLVSFPFFFLPYQNLNFQGSVQDTVDERNPVKNHLGCIKPPAHNEINYQPQLVQDFFRQQYVDTAYILNHEVVG